MKKSLIFVLSFLIFSSLLFVQSCRDETSIPSQPENSTASLNKNGGSKDCVSIQSGTLLTSDGQVIKTGFDKWGYNYQAHLFNGYYCDAYRDAAWCQDYKDVKLEMKWNDAWLSNKDCDGDGLLDRHYGFTSYIGSGAWITNHMSGSYTNADGKKCRWNNFIKIVAAPSDAFVQNGYWYTADNKEIGAVIWGDFAVIQEIYNDPCEGEHGVSYLSPIGPGFGKF
ncbi:MAG: hypothetical protein KJ571_11970 [Bacteroidetes bacterium]|nr:hypothetical protein [Bacteroidota bacterium]